MKLEIAGTVEGVQHSLIGKEFVQLWMRVDAPRVMGGPLTGPAAMVPISAGDAERFRAGERVRLTLELVEA